MKYGDKVTVVGGDAFYMGLTGVVVSYVTLTADQSKALGYKILYTVRLDADSTTHQFGDTQLK